MALPALLYDGMGLDHDTLLLAEAVGGAIVELLGVRDFVGVGVGVGYVVNVVGVLFQADQVL